MPKDIKFTASGSSNQLGNFGPGDIARNLPDALADHLVKEAMCAEYLKQAVAPVASPAADPDDPAADAPASDKPAPKPAAKRGSKTTTEPQKDA